MIRCGNCEQLVADGANFCHLCGERIQGEPPPVKPLPRLEDPPRFPPVLMFVLVAGAVALVVALTVALLRNEGPTQPRDPALPDDGASVVIPELVAPQPPTPAEVLASDIDTDLTVELNCDGCEVALLPADDGEPLRAVAEAGTAVFRLPARRTLGLALSVRHPQGFGNSSGYNIAVLSPADAVPAERVTVADVAQASAVGVCWSGTTQPSAVIELAVEAFRNASDQGGLRVWSPAAEAVLEAPIAPAGDGTVDLPALAVCEQAFAALAD